MAKRNLNSFLTLFLTIKIMILANLWLNKKKSQENQEAIVTTKEF